MANTRSPLKSAECTPVTGVRLMGAPASNPYDPHDTIIAIGGAMARGKVV
jgi:hypothetical protein